MPTPELVRLQGTLNPFQSTLWEGQGTRIFIARVTASEPDLVNDLETIVESAAPSHVEQAEAALVLTPRNVHALPMDPLKHLMADRVAFDARHANRLRNEIPTTAAVRLFRATDDPKRRLRLAIRIAQERVADLDDDDLLDAAEALGTELETGLKEVHCVYIIAGRDHVRLATDAIVPELMEKWDDPARRERLAQERLEEQMAAEAERQQAKAALDDELRRRFAGRVAVAPVRSMEPVLEHEANVLARREIPVHDIHRKVDALEARVQQATSAVQSMQPSRPVVFALDDLAHRLQQLGYAVRMHPPVPGHAVDLAAERSRFPARVIAFEFSNLDRSAASVVQKAVQALRVDAAVVIAERVDRPARRQLDRRVHVVQPSEARDLTL